MNRFTKFAFLTMAQVALAGPIGFEDSWAVMAYSTPDMFDSQVSYSFTYRLGLGIDYSTDTMNGPERQWAIARMNYLIHRWNGTDSQGNLYVSAGGGTVLTESISRPALMGAIESDFETRSIYFSGKASTAFAVMTGNIQKLTYLQLRAGVAPYTAEFEEFHSWIMLQTQIFPSADEGRYRIGPLLRFYYRNVLWEIGVTTQRDWNFNFMIHF